MAHALLLGPPLVIVAGLVGACGPSGSSRSAEARSRAADSVAAVKPGELRLSNVMIGKRVGPGHRIAEPTFQFAPQDTVYVSVGTEGAGDADSLTVVWRFQTGEILLRSSGPLAGGENAAFQLAQAKGLKPGTYKVIIFLNRDSVDTKVFAVKK